ncbi:hypothetical protein ERJ75_000525000 [Trypanosoma vivax]|nr:hypothetical protein ERJ75_000525000 [Trypanosoma vivax]
MSHQETERWYNPKDGRREKVVLGAGSLAFSYRAECVAMEAGLKRLGDVMALSKTHRTRVVAFTDSLSLLMALEHWSCSGGGRDTEAHLGPHTAHCAASRSRQLPVRVLAVRCATKRGGRQGS